MVARDGAYAVEARIQKREPARLYYRRWPYDGYEKRVGMDVVDLVMPSNPLKDLIAEEGRDELLSGLTARELEVATWSEMGYKPRDMAEMRGKKTSNADRWIKHRVKERFVEKLEPNDPLVRAQVSKY